MQKLLTLSQAIDRMNHWIGRMAMWLVLLSVVISASNAIVRKIFNIGSNSFLEIQWYLYAAVFLLGTSYTLLHQGHVKIDVILSRFSRATQVKVEIFGTIVFLFPFVISVVIESMPIFLRAFYSGEMSENAGGLIRWPVYVLIPIGFTLLGIQGISEIIKRIGFLYHLCPDPALIDDKNNSDEPHIAKQATDMPNKGISS